MKINLPIGKLAKYIEEFNNCKLLNNQELHVSDLNIRVPIVNNTSKVNYFIKKFALPMVEITFSNGYIVRVAKKHIFQQNGNDIFAENLSIGSLLDHRAGQVRVINIINVPDEDCFDISIDAPHVYYDANGLLHHNTLMTAALSASVEQYGRSIVIVPNKSLVTQTELDYKNLQLDVGVYFGDRKEWGKTHTICTWQSLNNLLKESQNGSADVSIKEFIEDVVCLIVDECFDGNEKVLTVDGYVPIKDIKPGDVVINYSENLGVFKKDIVVNQHVNLAKSMNEKMYE